MKGEIKVDNSKTVISVSISPMLLMYVDTEAEQEKRTRSNMIECMLYDWFIRKDKGKEENEEKQKD